MQCFQLGAHRKSGLGDIGDDSIVSYDQKYYEENAQIGDRPALWFYARLIHRLIQHGPILDFGCGTGYLVRRLRRWTVTDGFELSAFARSHGEKLSPTSRFFSDIELIPSNYYNGIVSLHVLEHINDEGLDVVLRCWRRIARPGAKFVLVVPDVDGLGHSLKKEKWMGFRDPTHINLKSATRWIDFFSAKGLTVDRAGTDGLWDFPYVSVSKAVHIAWYGWWTVAQVLAGRMILRTGCGESVILFGRIEKDNS
jgi:SAM-dependent methyltransferase